MQTKDSLIVMYVRDVNNLQESIQLIPQILATVGPRDRLNIITASGTKVYSSMRSVYLDKDHLIRAVG